MWGWVVVSVCANWSPDLLPERLTDPRGISKTEFKGSGTLSAQLFTNFLKTVPTKASVFVGSDWYLGGWVGLHLCSSTVFG